MNNEQCYIQNKMENLRNRINVKLVSNKQKQLFKMDIQIKRYVIQNI